MVQKGIYKQK